MFVFEQILLVNIFCSIRNIVLTWFHANNKNNNNKASFMSFEQSSRPKTLFLTSLDYLTLTYKTVNKKYKSFKIKNEYFFGFLVIFHLAIGWSQIVNNQFSLAYFRIWTRCILILGLSQKSMLGFPSELISYLIKGIKQGLYYRFNQNKPSGA